MRFSASGDPGPGSPSQPRDTAGGRALRLRAGFTLGYDCPQPTPVLLVLKVRPERHGDLLQPDALSFEPPLAVPPSDYVDGFGNFCGRAVLPAGETRISTRFEILDDGLPDPVTPAAAQHPVEDLPDEVLVYLLASRYCDSDRLLDIAWRHLGHAPPGWARVQAVCDFVHGHLHFDYMAADRTRSAWDGYHGGTGVCRDFAHLAIALCRALNVPARYVTGYLGDIGVPPDPNPPDFSAWFEAYLGGRWHTFDARHNAPRIGRIPMARGRDAADVALTTNFGPTTLTHFEVVTEEVGVTGD
jgi:transglutaminase-like putative cysteine protease